VDLVADRGALGDARSHPRIAGAGEYDRRPFRAQVSHEVPGDVPVELGLGVAAVGLCTGGVAGLGLKMSLGGPTSRPRVCSGDMNPGEPTTVPV
jgi:hypothetical protein